ncbi:ATP-binding cassette domain-containing protein [Patescibacteria group bacterium]|jgi:ATP-binding cassette subfamily F protein 3|nr:ATP-binding cassette domain-containing protein [Patescibacteria group bacterium]
MSVLLHIEGLDKAHGPHVLFENASVSISEGDKIGFIGRNGAGKSTLLHMIVGGEAKDAGEIVIHPACRLGYLKQHDDFEPGESVIAYLERASGKEEWACAKMAGRFDIKKERLLVPIESLSGGYRMRVKLAAMLLHEPNLMLLDEPTNFLDLQTQLLLEHFLQEWNGAFIIVSHDREFLMETCEQTMEAERGKLFLFPRPVNEYLEYKEEKLALDVKFNQNIETQKKHLESFINRFRAKASKASQAQSKMKQLRKLKTIDIASALKTVKIRIPAVEHRKQFAVRALRLAIGYGDRVIASDISFEIDRGMRVAILGENGKGKSTLLKTLAGRIEKLDGTYTWNNRLKLGFYDQHASETLHPTDTVWNYLERTATPGTEREDLMRMAGDFLFPKDDLEKPISVLSGGERSRLVLAGLLLSRPEVLLLDEPTNHLDLETVEALGNALRRWNGTVLFISHSRTFVNLVATRILDVRDGTVRSYPGTYEEYVYDVAREEGLISKQEQLEEKQEREKGTSKAERHEKQKELKRAISKIEKQLDSLEEERSGIMKLFTQDPAKFDLERTKRLSSLETMIQHTEAEWNRLTEELAKSNNG